MAATNFTHQPGKRGKRRGKQHARRAGLGIGGNLELLVAHRELELLRQSQKPQRLSWAEQRRRVARRARKLEQARGALEAAAAATTTTAATGVAA